MHKWLKFYPIVFFVFFVLCVGVAGAATIQSVPLIPRALQGADKVPVDYAGNANAFTANMDQISTYAQGKIGYRAAAFSNASGAAQQALTKANAAATYPSAGIPYSIGNGWGISFNGTTNKIPANYVQLPQLPQTKAPCGNGYHLDSFDATTGLFTCSADASVGGANDPNAIHTNASGEIAGLTAKVAPSGADLMMIEDAGAGNTKKLVRVDSLPYQPQGSYLPTSAIGATVQAHSAALDAVAGTNTGDETQGTIKSKLGAAGPSDGYLTAAQYVTLSNAVQPPSVSSTLMGWANGAWTGIRAALDSVYHGVTVTWAEITGKPTFGTASAKDVPASGNASSTQVVLGTDTRLTDSRTPLAHNQAWSTITSTPSTLAGYSIGDAYTKAQVDTSLAAKENSLGNPASNGYCLQSTTAGTRTWGACGTGGTTTKAAAYPSTDDNYGVTAAYLEAALNSGFTISTSDATQKGKPAMWNATTGVLESATPAAVGALFTGGGTYLKADGTTGNPGGTGTVTSVGVTTPSFLTVTGSPVTGSGTIALGLNAANYIPTTGDKTYWDQKQGALTSGSSIKTVGGVSLLGAGDLGTIGAGYGGTGVTDFSFSGTAHKVASVGFTNPASNKCVEVDSTGKLVIAGSNATCGSGGTGLSTSLTAAHLYVGNSGGTATDTAMSGDCTMSSTGAITCTKSAGSSFGSNAFTSTTYQTPQTTIAGYGITDAYTKAQVDSSLATKLTDPSTNPDGTHRVNVRNSVARSYTPAEGDLDTDSAGKIWLYTSGQWVEKGAAVPVASASTSGTVKVGSGLAIDGSGVLSATASGGSGLTVVAPFSGTQTIAVNNRYTTTATSRLTFSGHAAGTTTVLAKADTTLVPDNSSGVFTWLNPITRASSSTTAGYSALLKAGTYADIVSNGDGTFQVNANANPQATGTNEYAGGGGSTFYWSMNSTTVDSPAGYTAVAGSPATLQSGGPSGNYMDAGGAYHNGIYTIANAASLLNKATTGRVKLSFYVTNNLPKRLFMTTGDQYAFTAYVDTGNVLTFQMGDDSSRATASVTSNAWHTAEFYWSGSTMGMILDGGVPTTHAIAGSRGTGTGFILGDASSFYSADKMDEVYFYAN